MALLKILAERIYMWLLCSLVYFFSCTSLAASHSSGDETAQRILDLQRMVNRVPGMSAAVWQDGKIIWHGETGYRDISKELKVDAKTRFRLASVSKVFAASAAAKLVEDGKLNVDAPLRDYLPWINPAWSHITVRQLAAHTSGIPHYQAIDVLRGGHRFLTTKEAIDTFQYRDLLFASGSQYSYSSYGYTLLTGVIEAVTKQAYLDYLQQEIVTDLPIQADMAEKYDDNMSRAYELTSDQVKEAPAHDYSYSWGGAGMTSTALDLANFGGRMLDGKILSEQSLAWLQQETKLNNGDPVAERDFRLGFGWRVAEDRHDQAIMHHAGVTSGARSVIILFPKLRMAISLLSNASWTSAIEQTALAIAEAFRPLPRVGYTQSCPLNLRHYQGTFSDVQIQGTISFQLRDGRCEAEMQVDNALGKWIGDSAKSKVGSVRLVGYNDAHFSRTAMVTPIGSFYLQGETPIADVRELTAKINPNRRLKIRLHE